MPKGTVKHTARESMEVISMKLRKATALGLASILTVSALAVPAAAEDAKQYQTNTLQVAIWDNNQLAGLQQIADEWSEKSGVKVNIDVITWNEYWTLLEAGASHVGAWHQCLLSVPQRSPLSETKWSTFSIATGQLFQ